jgi:hypothetical protein
MIPRKKLLVCATLASFPTRDFLPTRRANNLIRQEFPMQRVLQKLAAVAMLTQATVCASATLDFSGGFANSGSTLNFINAAKISGSRARLTGAAGLEVGSVWSKNQVDIRKFTCQFSFQITPVNGNFEAGFTFAIQRAGNNVSGYPYESLGYNPISPSVGLKFDIWPNASNTGLYLNGEYPGDFSDFDMRPSVDLHSQHVFLVTLVYDGVTLHESVTDTSTGNTFTHDYTIDLVATIGGIHAYVGFTGSTGGTATLHDILTWTYSVTPSTCDVDFTAFPEHLQLYPRNRTTNTAIVPIAGSELVGGFTEAVLRVYRDGVQVGNDQVRPLTYTNGKAPFSFMPTITAELFSYDVELLLRKASGEISVRRATNIVAGDVFIIQGQSNATAQMYSGSANAYINQFVRTFGLESELPQVASSFASWAVANGDNGSFDAMGGVGQWGLVLGNLLVTQNNVPVAILNGGLGGQPIAFFQRNDANPTDPATNYGRSLSRVRAARLNSAVRSILYYQGESDFGNGPQYEAGFNALRSDWLTDYSSVERLYVFQLRENGGEPRFYVDLRNRQRLFADQFPNLSVLSTNGLDGHIGLHFNFANGYQTIGINTARALERDIYGGQNFPNTDPPNPAYAVLARANQNIIRVPLRNKTDTVTFQPGAEADFAVTGASVSVTSGTISNGVMELHLSGSAAGATSLVYTGHSGDGGQTVTGKWVANANGIGLLAFIEPIRVDTTPPLITLLGPNPVVLNVGQAYTDPGATASDNLDGDITSSIVVDSSAVNTAVPGNYPVTYNVSDVAGNAAAQVTRTVHVNTPPTIDVEQPAGVSLIDGGSTVDFGSVARNADNSHTFIIKDTGEANLNGLSITFDGANADEFAVTAPPTNPVTPGGSTTFTIKFTPTALGERNAALHIASNDPAHNPFDVALTGTGITNVEAWRLQYFGSTENNGDGADSNDFDLDGLANILEFATGTDPKQGNAGPGGLVLNAGTLEFVYPRAKAAINDGIIFRVEWTDDLVLPNWSNAGVSETVLSEDNTLQQVKASVSAGDGARRFLHLKIIRP